MSPTPGTPRPNGRPASAAALRPPRLGPPASRGGASILGQSAAASESPCPSRQRIASGRPSEHLSCPHAPPDSAPRPVQRRTRRGEAAASSHTRRRGGVGLYVVVHVLLDPPYLLLLVFVVIDDRQRLRATPGLSTPAAAGCAKGRAHLAVGSAAAAAARAPAACTVVSILSADGSDSGPAARQSKGRGRESYESLAHHRAVLTVAPAAAPLAAAAGCRAARGRGLVPPRGGRAAAAAPAGA